MVKESEIEIELERQAAYTETIMNPIYIENRIKEYQDDIERCRDMIKFYKKSLREVKNPKTKIYKLSKKYKLQ
jgi:hypothetical protein